MSGGQGKSDIEERDRLIAALHHERERLQDIFMRAPALIATLRGPEHRYETANALYLEFVGRRDVVGRTIREVLPEIEAQGWMDRLDHVYRTGEPFVGEEVKITLRRENGSGPSVAYINLLLEPLSEADGSISGVFIHGVDVTNQVLAREELEEAGRRLAFLAEASTLLASSLEYEETLANLSRLVVTHLADWCTVTLLDDHGTPRRVAAAQAEGAEVSLAHELYLSAPPSRASHGPLFRALGRGEIKLFPHVDEETLGEITNDPEQQDLLRRMGVDSALVVPLGVQERIIGGIFMSRTAKRSPFRADEVELAQELARRAAVAVDNARLHRSVQELNEGLERRVRERTKELESFSYSVSHDLRAPLRGIDGFSQALLEEFGERLDDTGRSYLERIRAGARRMGELIDDLLKLARVSREPTRTDLVDLSRIAEEVAEEIRGQDPDRDVEVRVEPGLRAYGNARLLKAMLENLLGNAWKFTRNREKAVIEVGRQGSDRGDAFFVRDNGAGFDMAYSHLLFAAFKRLHGPEEFEGTGVGLATVERIVSRHGGEIWAEGAVGEGATFYFTLAPRSVVKR